MIGRTVAHYTILERLGGGGMGVVFRARDERLGRSIAIKFLAPHLGQEPSVRERFTREARAASALDHANLCTVYDVGETDDGSLYLCMAFYEGESLHQRLQRGAMPLDEAAAVARQAAAGLGRAHEAGIVHRDVKPGNLMVTERGEVKLVDFGLADLAGDPNLTISGTTLGTVPYMSPEQVRGERLDHRTDLWSLGVVLYEMLTGRRPFPGENEAAVYRAIQEDVPAPPSALRPEVPAALDRLVLALLDKDRDRRPQSGSEVVAALDAALSGIEPPLHSAWSTVGPRPAGARRPGRRALAAGALAAVAGVAALALWLAAGRPAEPPRAPGLAVMPFADYTGGPAHAQVGEGIAAGLIARLGRLEGLRVVGRSEAWRLRDRGGEAADIGRRLGVGALLEGAVAGDTRQLQVTATLLDVGSGEVVWSTTLQGPADGLLGLERELADRLVRLLEITLTPGERRRLARDPTGSYAAYEVYLRGDRLLEEANDATGYGPAVRVFRQAVELDGEFALAWVGLGTALWAQAREEADAAAMGEAEEAARRALALDPDLHEAHVALARVLRDTGRGGEAVDVLRAALARHPRPEEVHLEMAAVDRRVGDLDAAESALRAATAVAPDSWQAWNRLGGLLWTRGQYDGARAAFERAAAAAPAGVATPRENLVAVEVSQGRFAAAIEAVEGLSVPITSATLASNVGTAYYFSDHPQRWERAEHYYRLAVRLQPRSDAIRRNLADLYVKLGREDEARDEYRRALALVEERLAADPDDVDLRLSRGLYAARAGSCAAATAEADAIRGQVEGSAEHLRRLAYVDALCQRPEEALGSLEAALELGIPPEVIRAEDEFAALRDDPRFAALLDATATRGR